MSQLVTEPYINQNFLIQISQLFDRKQNLNYILYKAVFFLLEYVYTFNFFRVVIQKFYSKNPLFDDLITILIIHR